MGGQWPLTCLPSSLQIRWEKNITLGEPPGFLHSWWWCVQGLAWAGHGGGSVGACGETIVPPAAHSVFWDLYCAAPDRREACEHSSEAKAFQDYVSPRQGQALPGRGGRWGGGGCMALAWLRRAGHWGPVPSTGARVTHRVGEAHSTAPHPPHFTAALASDPPPPLHVSPMVQGRQTAAPAPTTTCPPPPQPF